MKNLSKVLAVVLAFAMALSMVSFAAYTDVAEDANYSEAVAVLSDLKILTGYEDGSFKPEATITRAEFATVVIRMLGLADSASGGAEIFTDVAADHWANGYIALAAQQGIVNGYGDGRFGPEDPVKYQEAIKMVVAALGYTPMADANGGYPGGYKVVASQRGILAGISGAKDNEAATRAIVAQLAYNSLAVPLMEQVGFGTQTNFEAVNSMLLNKLGVTKFEGTVSGTSASGATKAGQVEIKANKQITAVAKQYNAIKATPAAANTNPQVSASYISGIKLDAAPAVEEAAKALLDTAVIIYVKDATSEDAEIVSILKDGNRNAVVEFMAEDLKTNAALNSAAVDTLEVYTDKDAGEYEEYDVDIDTVYVNGQKKAIEAIDVAPAGAGAEDLAAGDAISASADLEYQAVVNHYLQSTNAVDVKLLSNGTDEDVYNVAYITVWADYVVNSISARNFRVYYNGGSIVLDETSKTQNFTIYKDGEVAEFADIEENDVLSIAGYKNGSNELVYGDVYITSEKVEGTVNGKAAGATNEIKVDGENYKTTGSVKSAVKLGDSAVFYVNARGVLVGLDKTASGSNLKYGFASYVYVDPNFGDAQVRLLSADGKWATYDVAAKFTTVNVGGTATFKATEKTVNWGSQVGGIAGAPTGAMYNINNVVAYELNEDGEIDLLYAKAISGADSEFEALGSGLSANKTTKDKVFVADTDRIGSIDIDEDTTIFTLDATLTINANTKLTDEDLVSVVAVSTLLDREAYNVMAGYNMDDDTFVVPVIIGHDIVSGIDWTSDFFVVSEDPYETTNEDGDEGLVLTGIVGGEETTVFLNKEDMDNDISGDDTDDVKKVVYDGGTANIKTTTHNDFDMDNIAKGDVIIYSLNAKGEAAKVYVLVDASDITTVDGRYDALSYINATTDAQGRLGEVTISSTTYTFIMGYAKDMDNGKVTLVANDGTLSAGVVTGYSENIYRFAADTVGAIYDEFTGNGKVTEAMYGDVTTDPTFGTALNANDGDMVFAKVSNGVVIEDFVIIANDR